MLLLTGLRLQLICQASPITIEVSELTVILIQLPEVTTTLVFPEESYVFSVTTDTIGSGESTSYCGTYSLTGGDGAANDPCLPGITTVINLPSAANALELYLYATGHTTSFLLPGITTTFVAEQKIYWKCEAEGSALSV